MWEGDKRQGNFRTARRDMKVFVSEQCKEIEGNNRMEKTRDLFKKIRDAKETFHAKMGMIKDRNSMDLAEAEEIKERWQEYTEDHSGYQCQTNDFRAGTPLNPCQEAPSSA